MICDRFVFVVVYSKVIFILSKQKKIVNILLKGLYKINEMDKFHQKIFNARKINQKLLPINLHKQKKLHKLQINMAIIKSQNENFLSNLQRPYKKYFFFKTQLFIMKIK